MQSNSDQTIVSEDVFFSAGSLRLHGELAYPQVGTARAAVLIAGPHPLLGGNMRNNVVRRLGEGLAEMGLVTLRFDYRGVGRSQGPRVEVARNFAEFWKTSHFAGETQFALDLKEAAEFLAKTFPGLPTAAVGYSFGCSLLPCLRDMSVSTLVLMAPTLEKHDYSYFLKTKKPMLVIASNDDFATDTDKLLHWFNTLSVPRRIVRRQCDNHFFRGHEDWVVGTISRYLDDHWSR